MQLQQFHLLEKKGAVWTQESGRAIEAEFAWALRLPNHIWRAVQAVAEAQQLAW